MSMKKIFVPVLKSYEAGDVKVDLSAILNAPYEDISEAAEAIPGWIGWFGYQKGMAIEALLNSEFAWKQAEATQYFELKNGAFVTQGFGEKPTEAALEKAVNLTDPVKAAADEYAACKRHLEWISSTIEALKAKLELVRSSEATRRMEHEPDRNKGTRE